MQYYAIKIGVDMIPEKVFVSSNIKGMAKETGVSYGILRGLDLGKKRGKVFTFDGFWHFGLVDLEIRVEGRGRDVAGFRGYKKDLV